MQNPSRYPIRFSLAVAAALSACASHQTTTSTSTPANNGSPPPTNASATSSTDASVDSKLMAAIAGPQRTAEERARDVYRHPRETLEFFGIQPGMHVVELSGGRGWYTAILAPLLGPTGSLTVTVADPNGPADSEGTKNSKGLAQRISSDPANFGNVLLRVTDWNLTNASLGADGSADMVLTFRNWHGWVSNGVLDNVLAATKRVLKSGGVFGVVEHRAKPDGSIEPQVIGKVGYVPETLVVKAAENAGFKLVGRSEINANPNDTKDYPKGVWTLPPTLSLGDVDRDKYTKIGESDRMTLKFVKP